MAFILSDYLRGIEGIRRAEKQLRKVIRALKTLSECNQVVIRAEEETELLSDVCKIMANVGGYSLVWVGYAQDDKEKSVIPVAQAGFEKETLRTSISCGLAPEMDVAPPKKQ